MKKDWQVHTLNTLDKEKWDQLNKNSRGGSFFNQSFILEALPIVPRFFIYGDYDSGICIPYSKFGPFKRVLQPTFIQKLGFISSKEFDPSIPLKALQTNRIPFINQGYNFNEGNSDLDFRQLGKRLITKKSLILNLKLGVEEIQKRYSTNLKRNIKKAHKHQLTEKSGQDTTEFVIRFFEEMGNKIPALKEQRKETIKVLLSRLQSMNQLRLVYAEKPQGSKIAGLVLVKFKNRTTYWLGYSTSEGLNLGAMPFLLDSALRKESEDSTIFDFEGGNLKGTKRFFEQFRPEEETYPSLNW